MCFKLSTYLKLRFWPLFLTSITFFFLALPAFGAASFGDKLGGVVGWLIGIFISALSLILILVIKGLILIATYQHFIDSQAVIEGWVVVRDFSNMFFVVILLVIAFSTILNLENYNYKKWLPKLILMAILINFSKTICGLMIDVAQIIMLTFVNAFKDIAGANIIDMLGIKDVVKLAEGDDKIGFWTIVGAYVLGLFYVIIAIVVVTTMMMMLAMRLVIIWIYVVLSPLAYLLAAFPGGVQYSSKWWKEFTQNLIVGPVLAFFIWLSFAALQTGSDLDLVSTAKNENIKDEKAGLGINEPVAATEASTPGALIKFIIGIGMLIGGLKISQEIGGAAGSIAGKGMSKISTMGAAVAGGIAGFAIGKAKDTGRYLGRKGIQGTSKLIRGAGDLFGKKSLIKTGELGLAYYQDLKEANKKRKIEKRKKFLEKIGVGEKTADLLSDRLKNRNNQAVSNTLKNAAIGATIGSIGGPIGMIGGSIAGIGLSLLTRWQVGKNDKKINQAKEDVNQRQQELNQAESNFSQSDVNLNQARTNFSQADKDLNQAKQELSQRENEYNEYIRNNQGKKGKKYKQKESKLLQKINEAQQKVNDAQNKFNIAEQELNAAQSNFNTNKGAVDQARANFNQAQQNLKNIQNDPLVKFWDDLSTFYTRYTAEAAKKIAKVEQDARQKIQSLANDTTGTWMSDVSTSLFYSSSGQTPEQEAFTRHLSGDSDDAQKARDNIENWIRRYYNPNSDKHQNILRSLAKGIAATKKKGEVDISSLNSIIDAINAHQNDIGGTVEGFQSSVISYRNTGKMNQSDVSEMTQAGVGGLHVSSLASGKEGHEMIGVDFSKLKEQGFNIDATAEGAFLDKELINALLPAIKSQFEEARSQLTAERAAGTINDNDYKRKISELDQAEKRLQDGSLNNSGLGLINTNHPTFNRKVALATAYHEQIHSSGLKDEELTESLTQELMSKKLYGRNNETGKRHAIELGSMANEMKDKGLSNEEIMKNLSVEIDRRLKQEASSRAQRVLKLETGQLETESNFVSEAKKQKTDQEKVENVFADVSPVNVSVNLDSLKNTISKLSSGLDLSNLEIGLDKLISFVKSGDNKIAKGIADIDIDKVSTPLEVEAIVKTPLINNKK